MKIVLLLLSAIRRGRSESDVRNVRSVRSHRGDVLSLFSKLYILYRVAFLSRMKHFSNKIIK